ncbi:two-component system sensor histidine kinase NtrB [Candidatus Electrothrix sp.]|uniref:two-component system sensor histidine kinase NtrB n=1 Tax=Candidatus Electrothrix sp. TaxID=2170559 RepID=UPI004057C3F3
MPINKLIRELTPVQDSSEQLRRHLGWMIMTRVMLFTLLIAVTVVLQHLGRDVILPPSSVTMAFLSVVFIYSIGSTGLLQTRKKHLPRFGLIQVLSDTVFSALLVLGTGCSQSIFRPIFIFPVLVGGLNLNRIGSLLAATASSLLYGAILLSEYFEYIPPFYSHTNYIPPDHFLDVLNKFAVYVVVFYVIGVSSSIVAARLRTTEEALTRTSVQFDRLNLLYKQIFDDINTGIITVDGRHLVTSCNIAFEKITGFSAGKIIGLPFDSFFPAVILEENDESKQTVDLIRHDGRSIRVRFTLAQLNLPSDPEALYEQEDARCKVITMQDISLLEKMEQQVRDSEKMATIGELSGAVAHDFRNPLAAISGSAQILHVHILERLKESDDPIISTNRHLIDIILRETDRMEKTINDFLQFSHPKELEPEWFNLKRVVLEAVRQIQGKKSRYPGCTIQTDIPEHLDCWGDRQQVQIMLVHLLQNSCFASKDCIEPVLVQVRDAQEDSSTLCIAVIDKGTGFTDTIRKKAFIPFFSTREDSAGLGLAIVQQFVEQHSGVVDLLEPEEGSIVEIRLPLPALPTADVGDGGKEH